MFLVIVLHLHFWRLLLRRKLGCAVMWLLLCVRAWMDRVVFLELYILIANVDLGWVG